MQYKVSFVGTCYDAEQYTNRMMSDLAVLTGEEWKPIAYGFHPDAECVSFWVDDGDPLTFNHSVELKERFVEALTLVQP